MLKALRRLIAEWIEDLIPDPFTPAWGFGYAAIAVY